MYRCGNCYKWMKTTSCPREQEGQKPSCNTISCTEFVRDKDKRKSINN